MILRFFEIFFHKFLFIFYASYTISTSSPDPKLKPAFPAFHTNKSPLFKLSRASGTLLAFDATK